MMYSPPPLTWPSESLSIDKITRAWHWTSAPSLSMRVVSSRSTALWQKIKLKVHVKTNPFLFYLQNGLWDTIFNNKIYLSITWVLNLPPRSWTQRWDGNLCSSGENDSLWSYLKCQKVYFCFLCICLFCRPENLVKRRITHCFKLLQSSSTALTFFSYKSIVVVTQMNII